MGNFFTSLFSSNKGEENNKEKIEQKNFDILKYDGVRAQKIGKHAYAIKCFNEALNLQEDFETLGFLVTSYTVTNQLEEALEAASRMVGLNPDNTGARLTRIQLLFMLDRDKEVIDDCQHIIQAEPENYIAFYQMAKAKRATGDQFGAIADLTKAITFKEDFPNAYLLRAEILKDMRQAEEALKDVEQTIQLAPEEENGFLLRGKIHMMLGDTEKAQADFQQTLELNPFNEEAQLLPIQLQINEGEYAEAIKALDEIIENNPEFAKAYELRGQVKNLRGDKAGAFEDLKKAVELDPNGDVAQKMNGQHSNFDNLYQGGLF